MPVTDRKTEYISGYIYIIYIYQFSWNKLHLLPKSKLGYHVLYLIFLRAKKVTHQTPSQTLLSTQALRVDSWEFKPESCVAVDKQGLEGAANWFSTCRDPSFFVAEWWIVHLWTQADPIGYGKFEGKKRSQKVISASKTKLVLSFPLPSCFSLRWMF